MGPVRVMRMITRMNLGGPALHVLELAQGLRARGYETALVTGVCEEGESDWPAPIPAELGVTILKNLSRSISPWRDLAACWRAYRLIRRYRPHIVHTHTAKAGLVGRVAAFAAGVPLVVHTFHGNSLSGYFSAPANAVFRALERLLARVTNRILVISDQQLEEISGRFAVAPRSKFQVVPLGVDLSAELRQPLPQWDGQTLTVGWLGRLVDIKGVPLLISIIDRAVASGLPVRFVVAGDGPERKLVEEAVAKHGPRRVCWSGWRYDLGALFQECHVLIQTSRNEGTPVALIQGMAAGRPFVSTAAGGVVDLVSGPPAHEESGCKWHANAVLAEPDPSAFVHALGRFHSDRECLGRMGSSARAFAAERFQASRLVADLDRIYQELLQERVHLRTADAHPAQTVAGGYECKF